MKVAVYILVALLLAMCAAVLVGLIAGCRTVTLREPCPCSGRDTLKDPYYGTPYPPPVCLTLRDGGFQIEPCDGGTN